MTESISALASSENPEAGPDAGDLRVLLGVPSLRLEYGGPAVTVPGLARALAGAGVQTGLLTMEAEEGAHAENGGPRVARVPTKGGNREYARIVRHFFSEGLPDLIHDNGIWLPFHHRIARIAGRYRIPRVVGACGALEPWALGRSRWKKRLAWAAYQKRDLQAAEVIHARTDQEARNLKELGLGKPIAVVTNGMVLPEDPFGQGVGEKAHRTALFLSRIHPKKGLLDLVEAWRAVGPAGWELVIAGPDEGGYLSEVQRAVERAGIVGSVRFPGPVFGEEKDRLFRQADLFVLPTYSENFGVAVAEALGWGVPTITTKGAPWPLLETNSCGWWVDIGSGPLAEAIASATSLGDSDRRAMGRRGRQVAEREFSWPKVAGQMLRVYRWVLSGGPKPDWVV